MVTMVKVKRVKIRGLDNQGNLDGFPIRVNLGSGRIFDCLACGLAEVAA